MARGTVRWEFAHQITVACGAAYGKGERRYRSDGLNIFCEMPALHDQGCPGPYGVRALHQGRNATGSTYLWDHTGPIPAKRSSVKSHKPR